MARKRKVDEIAESHNQVITELNKLKERAEELQKLYSEAEVEEKKLIESTREYIENYCKEKNLWCGLRLTKQDILNIVSLAIDTKDDLITIPFQLYVDFSNN